VPLVLAHPHEDGAAALDALAEALGASQAGPVSRHAPPELPADGAINSDAIMRIVGHYLPDNAIVSDKAIMGTFSYSLLDAAAPHDYLNLAGGAIGDGMPVATGAAIACPDRKVISLQADGSAMYTLQALWTQAREQLDITTIIYANRAYSVLLEELKGVGAADTGPKALSMMDLRDPTLNWVKLAEGMGIAAVQVDGVRALADAVKSGIGSRGPKLIEAIM
jgi:acetolactate synthase-1/2/3 large subunit